MSRTGRDGGSRAAGVPEPGERAKSFVATRLPVAVLRVVTVLIVLLFGGDLFGGGLAALQEDAPSAPIPPVAEAPRITLEEAIRSALVRSADLELAEAERDLAKADRLTAWGSFLPSIDLGYGHARSSTGRLDPTGQAITSTSWFTELTARYDLFSGLRRFSDLKSARLGVSAAGARYEEQRFRTILEVKRAFFTAVANRRLVEVERDRVRRQEAQLDSVRLQLEMGETAKTDILRSEVALNNARLALIRAENAARASSFGLASLIGSREPVLPASEAGLELAPLELERDAAVEMALRGGPSVRTARAEAEAAEAGVGSARSALLPELSVAGGYSWQSSRFPPESRSWRVFVFGSFPLFNGFRRESEISRASARAEAARAAERSAELELRAAVDSAYSLIRAGRASIRLAERTVELAGEELRMQREIFRLGRGSILELQNAQIALRQAEVDLVRSRLDHRLGVAQLEYLLGREVAPGASDRPETSSGGGPWTP